MSTKQIQSKRSLPEDFDQEEVFFQRSYKKVKGSVSSKNGNQETSQSNEKGASKENVPSRKPVFPLIIRKYLNSKGKMKIEDAINQLEAPLEKFHRKKLRQMKLLGIAQEKEIQEEILLRKKYNLFETSQHSNQTSMVDEFSTAILSPEGGEQFDPAWSAENWNFDDEFPKIGMEFQDSVFEKTSFSDSEQATWVNDQLKEHSNADPSNFEKEMDVPMEELTQQGFDPIDYSFPQFVPQQQETLSVALPVTQPNDRITYQQQEQGLAQFELSKSKSLANDQLQQISSLLHSKNQVCMMRPFHNNQFGFLPIASSSERQSYHNSMNFGHNGYLNYGSNPFNGSNFSSSNFQNGQWETSHQYQFQFQPIA